MNLAAYLHNLFDSYLNTIFLESPFCFYLPYLFFDSLLNTTLPTRLILITCRQSELKSVTQHFMRFSLNVKGCTCFCMKHQFWFALWNSAYQNCCKGHFQILFVCLWVYGARVFERLWIPALRRLYCGYDWADVIVWHLICVVFLFTIKAIGFSSLFSIIGVYCPQ